MTANRVWPAFVAALVCVAAALLSASQGPAPQAAPPQGAGMPQITFDLPDTRRSSAPSISLARTRARTCARSPTVRW
jgi:hypothetical protein